MQFLKDGVQIVRQGQTKQIRVVWGSGELKTCTDLYFKIMFL